MKKEMTIEYTRKLIFFNCFTVYSIIKSFLNMKIFQLTVLKRLQQGRLAFPKTFTDEKNHY